jgi:hypothetical protein
MAQTGFTPIQLYYSSTTTNAPLAANLADGELAINITDGKLFYKDNANAVQVIAWKVTPTTAGGTGLTSYTAGDLPYYASGTTLSKLAIGANTTVMTSSGSAPQWTAQSALSVGEASNLKSNATTGKMQITGPTAASTRVMTIPDANFTAARTDAAQTFAGAQTMSAYGAGIATFSSAGLISSTATTGTGNVMLASTIRFTDTTGNATPSISGCDPHYPITLQVSYATPYSITNITGGNIGQMLIVINRGVGAVTLTRNNMILNNSVAQVLAKESVISLVNDGTYWWQIAPVSVNG